MMCPASIWIKSNQPAAGFSWFERLPVKQMPRGFESPRSRPFLVRHQVPDFSFRCHLIADFRFYEFALMVSQQNLGAASNPNLERLLQVTRQITKQSH
jgi:hypothetical protein